MPGVIYQRSVVAIWVTPSHLVPVTLRLASQSVMTITDDMAALVGFGCEAFFYGAFPASTGKLIAHFSPGCYTILFAVSIYLMFHTPRRGTGVNKPILIISGFLFLSCSTHFALEFSHFYQVLVCATPY